MNKNLESIDVNVNDIGFYHLGNGYSICDRSREENGDFMKIAHADCYRKITFYKNVTKNVRNYIVEKVMNDDSGVSFTQPEIKIFKTPPISKLSNINISHINIINLNKIIDNYIKLHKIF